MVGRKILALTVLLALAGCGGKESLPDLQASGLTPVGAETVRAPEWRAGSEWHYSDGYGLKVARVEGDVTTFQRTDDPTQWVARRGFLREDAQSGTTLRKLIYENLPAGAGLVLSTKTPLTYRREFMSGSTPRAHATSWTVEGRETVKVPAGVFDCVVIAMRTRNLEDGWTGFERWWFSPQAQNYVRMEYRYGPDTSGSRVLVDYRLSGSTGTAASPPARAP